MIISSHNRRGAEQGFIRDTPCRNVVLPKRKKSRKNKALEEDKLKRFMAYLESKPWDEDFKRIIKALLYALGLFSRTFGHECKISGSRMDIYDVGAKAVKLGITENCVLIELVVLRLVEVRLDAVVEEEKSQHGNDMVCRRAAENGDILLDASRSVIEQSLFELTLVSEDSPAVKGKNEFLQIAASLL